MVLFLLVGIVLNPVVTYLGDVHEWEGRAVPVELSADDQQHLHPAVADAGVVADGEDDIWHGLKHVEHGHGASSLVFFIQESAVVPQNHSGAFPPTAPLKSLQIIAGPFRPPIA